MCIPTYYSTCMPERSSCAFFLFFDGGGCCFLLLPLVDDQSNQIKMTNKRREMQNAKHQSNQTIIKYNNK